MAVDAATINAVAVRALWEGCVLPLERGTGTDLLQPQ
jgi:hypothetical protein